MKPTPLVIRCQKHPSYTGLSEPRADCEACETVHHSRGASFERGIPAGKRQFVLTRIGWGAQ